MKMRKLSTEKELIKLGRATADIDIRVNKKLSEIASSVGIEVVKDEIITPAMPREVLIGYHQRMHEEQALTEIYPPNQKRDYNNENE